MRINKNIKLTNFKKMVLLPENVVGKVFSQLENVDRETSVKIFIVLFLVYLYHYAGFIFLLLSIYRGYKVVFEPSSSSLTNSSQQPHGDKTEDDSSFGAKKIETIALSVVKEFFGIKL